MRLDQPVNVVSHGLECGNMACSRRAVVYRPPHEDARALRGSTFGLEVSARMGARRDREPWSITKRRGQLTSDAHLSLSLTEVA